MARSSRIQTIMSMGVPRNVAEAIAKADMQRDRPSPRMEFRAQDNGEAELLLYDFIGFDLFGEGWTSQRFAEELAKVKGTSKLTVRINSPGGDVWDGMSIYNQLADFGSPTRVVIEGIAASAASLVAMAGDTIDGYETSQLMIHDAWTVVMGNEAELRDIADVLSKIDSQMAAVYASKSGRPASEWRTVMDRDHYLTSQEAKERGLIDNVLVVGASARAKAAPRRTREQLEGDIQQAKLGLLGISASSDGEDTRERVREARAQFQSEQPVDKSGERWRSAIHESAHGVTAIAQGQECYGLQLFDDDGSIAATCRLDSNRLTLATVYAGAIAELKERGRSYQRPGETDAGDLTLINNLVERMHPYDGTDGEHRREELKAEGRAVARRLVNAHWATIREVASKLYSRGSLSGSEVEAMVKDSKAMAATN